MFHMEVQRSEVEMDLAERPVRRYKSRVQGEGSRLRLEKEGLGPEDSAPCNPQKESGLDYIGKVKSPEGFEQGSVLI